MKAEELEASSQRAAVAGSQETANVIVAAAEGRVGRGKRIWIDLDNSPHVPFFLPIIEALRKRNYEVILTARNSYQVCDLLKFHNISCKVVGGHWGKNRVLKAAGTLLRAAQLLPLVGESPALAVSHGSRAQLVSSYLLRIPTLLIADYEFTAKVGSLRPDWVLMPHFISQSAGHPARRKVMSYPGLKEDVYVPGFSPDPSLKTALGLKQDEIVVTVRPPATEAHYHNPEAEVLLDAAMKFLMNHPKTRAILLPRNERQSKQLRKDWAESIKGGKVLIPEQVVDGLNLIWCSDLVISGGGTMNREAAALGIPVYSIFRGRIGGVDRYLAESGRLTLIERPEEISTKVILQKRTIKPQGPADRSAACESIVETIIALSENRDAREPRQEQVG